MLAGEAGDPDGDAVWRGGPGLGAAFVAFPVGLHLVRIGWGGICSFQGHLGVIPPVHLGHCFDAAIVEPLGYSQADEEMDAGVGPSDFFDGWEREVIMVVVT